MSDKVDAVNEAFAELARLKDEMKEATILIEELCHYIHAYEDQMGKDNEVNKDRIIATRWLERNNVIAIR